MSASAGNQPRFGRLLREFRIAAGFSQETLAERASMSVNGISALERGANQAPQRETLSLLIRALGLNADQAATLTRSAVRPSAPRDGARRHQKSSTLPLPATPFFGRKGEVEAVLQLLQSSALVTLTGPGGVGKTRLALKAGEEAAFRDGVRFVDLAPVRSGDLVPAAVAAQFGVKDWRDLQCKDALLIVDNCEHVLGAAASVVEKLLRTCRGMRIIATSRQSLNVPGEYIYRVSSLDADAAIDLFVERARRAGASLTLTDHTRERIARIVEQLDRIALAIELAAARTNVLTPEQLEARLTKRFTILTGGAVTQPRQHTMRTAIDWSYDLLDDEERRLFRQLSVFPKSFSLEAVLHVCEAAGLDGTLAFESLSCLVDKSLVLSEATEAAHRFRLLETIRAYAAEKLEEHAETAMLQRKHAEFFAALAESADCDFESAESTNAWISGLEPDIENFRAALDWSMGPDGDIPLAVRLIANLQEFWIAQGFANDISRRARATLLAHPDLNDADSAALWLTLARMPQELFTHPGEILEAAGHARELYERMNDRYGLALALRQYGTALMRLGDFAQAEAQLRQSVELYRMLGDVRMSVRSLGYLATLLQLRGDYAEARTALYDVLESAREVGDDRMVPTTSMNLAETEFALGDAESAARRALDNLNNDTLRKSREMHATQAANLAVYLFSLGKSDEARTAALDAIRLGSGSFVAVPLQHIAAIIAPTDARRAARLLGYVDAVFASTAFTRQHSERFTYDALMASLNTQLSEDALAECMREGASMSERLAVQQATAAPCVDSV